MIYQDTSKTSIKRTLGITSGLVVFLFIGTILSLSFDCRWCGVIATEIGVTIFFGFILVLRFFFARMYQPRPAAFYWSVFQMFAHILFCIAYVFLALKSVETGFCFICKCASSSVGIELFSLFFVLKWFLIFYIMFSIFLYCGLL